MDLNELVRVQREFDAKHGWNPDRTLPNAVFSAIQQDLIGMFGEIGEFANIVKKIALEADLDSECDLTDQLTTRNAELKEELIDAFIYLIRIASHLDVDIGDAYREKLKINEQRFKRFERPKS